MTWQIVKIIAIVSMTLDHAAATFVTQSFLIEQLGMSMQAAALVPHFLRSLGRIAFPLYAFGMAQGCTYTKNRGKFLLRLLVFAVLAEAPFRLALRNGTLAPLRLWPLPISNVLFTLLIGSLCCFIWDFFRKKELAWVAVFPIAALVLLAEMHHTDYGGLGVLFVLLPYPFQQKKWKLAAVGGMVLVLYLASPLIMHYTMYGGYLICALGAVGILALYNGQKGRQSCLSQYFFYGYYPLHLLLFYGLTQWIGPIAML